MQVCPLGLGLFLRETKHDTLKNLAVSHIRLYMAIVLKWKTVEISRDVCSIFQKFSPSAIVVASCFSVS